MELDQKQGATIKATCTSFNGLLAAVPKGPPPGPREGEGNASAN